jgi:hypothetical protein
MAKRATPRPPSDDDTEQSTPRRPARARAKKNGAAQTDQPIATANDTTRASEELPDIPEPGDVADQAQRSESMASEPSEQDIRLRAYHRYLERGGGHGQHFDDWVEAEKELKSHKSPVASRKS